jgi:hypothetical protein
MERFWRAAKNPQRETFVIEGDVSLGKLTGIRLEALPHEQLPRGGPGRDIYGNAIVSEIKVEIETSGRKWQPVRFSASYRTMDARRTSALENFGSSMPPAKRNAWPGNWS